MDIFIGIILPFLGTTLGAAGVFFIKKDHCSKIKSCLLGFAAGVMIAAGIWSLLLPAIEMSEILGKLSFLPATVGFLIGVFALILIDKLVLHLETKHDNSQKKQRLSKETLLLTIAVTLHNIPEGMAVGIVFAGLLAGSPYITLGGAMTIAIGITIQNIPEGTVISLPLTSEGKTKLQAFGIGTLSGIVEPIAAIITLLLTQYIEVLLPYLLAFAAGAMYFVVANELLPAATEDKSSYIGTIGFTIGFVIMMVLDVALG